MQILTVK